MPDKTVMILERSSQNLQRINKNDKITLEGVFCQFGEVNKNDRMYLEEAYLPHLQYLMDDIKSGKALLGELDHPDRFEVALGNVSHRITELWYDQAKRQVLGRLEILDGTPKGAIAKSLLEAGVPLSISSRAAGTVNDDKTVSIQQIYTYDLVARPGFENATLHNVNESQQARITTLITKLNESYKSHEEKNISSKIGIINENVSIIDMSDKIASMKPLREEAQNMLNKNKENNMEQAPKINTLNEDDFQRWTLYIKNELSNINNRLDGMEKSVLESNGNSTTAKQIKVIKGYVEKLRKIQEDSLNWQSDIAKAVNETATKISSKDKLIKKIVENANYNAEVINHTQDWVSSVAKTTNAIGNTVDSNADMLDGVNEWLTETAKAVNKLNEWGEEKASAINKLNEWNEEQASAVNDMHEWVSSHAKAINGIHEWTRNIAHNTNYIAEWSEEMFGRAVSKEDAKNIVEYIQLVEESKKDPTLKAKIDEALSKHSISKDALTEHSIKGIKVLDTHASIKYPKADYDKGIADGVDFDSKYETIVAKIGKPSFKKEGLPKGLKTLDDKNSSASKVTPGKKLKGTAIINATKTIKTPETKIATGTKMQSKDQNLKLDTKAEGKMNESQNVNFNRSQTINSRSSNLESKLAKLIEISEKERGINEQVKSQFPFSSMLNESDFKSFSALSMTDKQKVAIEVSKNPTSDTSIIKRIWESTLSHKPANVQPLWLTAAPKRFREIYDRSTEKIQESINSKAEFFDLDTQYKIDNFWEVHSGLSKGITSLNESVIAKPTLKSSEPVVDPMVAAVAEQMSRYKPRY